MMAPAQTLVVGLGNELQGLDGFGPAVVARLRERGDVARGTALIDAGSDLLGSLDRFATADLVVLVDAFLGSGSGEVSAIEESTFASWDVESPGVHDLSPVLAVRLFRLLCPAAPTRFILVGLDAANISVSTPLSSAQIDAGIGLVASLCRESPSCRYRA